MRIERGADLGCRHCDIGDMAAWRVRPQRLRQRRQEHHLAQIRQREPPVHVAVRRIEFFRAADRALQQVQLFDHRRHDALRLARRVQAAG